VVAANEAKTGIDEEIGQVVWMTYDAVNPFRAKDLVAYQHALRQKVDEAAEKKKEKGDADFGRRDRAENR
jgi:hypothetical protein